MTATFPRRDAVVRMVDVIDPSTGELVGSIPPGNHAVADALVTAARQAQPSWRMVPVSERAEVLRGAATNVRADCDQIALMATRENGRPLRESRASVPAGAATLDRYAELAPLNGRRSLARAPDATNFSIAEPRGVAVALTHWSDPIVIACSAIGACLALGNSLILKPSERSPFSPQHLVELVPSPDGVVQVAVGDARMGRSLAAHPGVDVVIHTGSIATGHEVAAACAHRLVKCVLELKGKTPLVVDAGVDPEWAADQAARGAFTSAGRLCTSVERI